MPAAAAVLVSFIQAAAPVLAQAPAEAPTYSVKRGFFSSPFQLTLTSPTPGATIIYTRDGSVPSDTNGTRYTAPIAVGATAVVRSVTTAPGYSPSRVKTHTYLFLDQVIRQPRSVSGWPQRLYDVGFLEPPEWPKVEYFNAPHDYEMDPDVVNDPSTQAALMRGLRSIPTMSLVMPKDAFWEVNDSDRGSDVERGVSVEILYPDGTTEQTDGGLVGHSHRRLKRSFRLAFRGAYGDPRFRSKIMQTGPLDGGTAATSFDKLVLRASNNRSWAHIFNDGRSAYTRDQWYRSSQIAMEGYGTRGNFVHLYVDGLYWGLYNVAERPDSYFTSDYLGGQPEDWYSWSAYSSVSGDPTWFNAIWQELNKQDLRDPVWYREYQAHMDLPNFSDYLILTWYMGMTDWPQKNFWGANRNMPSPEPFLHFAWDGEWSFDTTHGSSNGGWVHPWFRTTYTGTADYIPNSWRALRQNEEYMTLFSDRVFKHLSEGGALADAASRARWKLLNDYIRDAIVAESARWGDAMEFNGQRLRTRALDWEPEVARLDGLMNGNAERFKAALRAQGYYPPFDPPTFDQPAGTVPPGTPITLTTPVGTIYYTTDGSDPRREGGIVSANARNGGSSVQLPIGTAVTITTRVKQDTLWSALDTRTYYTAQDLSPLVINEIHYHPLEPTALDPDLLEFVEIWNNGPAPLELAGVSFTDGVEYTFPIGASIDVGSYAVLARDRQSFQSRYGFDPDGEYAGKLANDGELLVLSDPAGGVIDSVRYGDKAPWPTLADGQGPSLELIDPSLDNTQPGNWKASRTPGGSPKVVNAENEAPTAVITSPSDGGRIDPGSPVVIAVTAEDADGSVRKVSFHVGTKLLGEDLEAPFEWAWQPTVGSYVLTATAIDNVGARTKSEPVSIRVETAEPCAVPLPRVVINEINYNAPVVPDAGDWLELANADSDSVDVSGWVFKDENDHNALVLPPGSWIDGKGWIVLAEKDSLFRAVHAAFTGRLFEFGGHDGFNLSNGGELLRLYSPSGCLADTVRYDDAPPWPTEPDGGGQTLALLTPAFDNGVAENWAASAVVGGTPGAANLPNTPPTIAITAPADRTRFDPGSDVVLAVEAADADPGGSVVSVRYFVGNERLGRVDAPPFSLIWIAPVVGTYRVRAVAVDDAGAEASSAEIIVTVGAENACDLLHAALVVTEINYNADPEVGGGDWIEIFNPRDRSTDLSGWVVKGQAELESWTIPEGEMLDGLGYVAVAEDTVRFRAVYPNVERVLGPFGGLSGFSIGNDGDRIRLYTPAGCWVDEVPFSDRSPWPEEPDGRGRSLALLNPGLDNADPANWGVSGELKGSPGGENSPNSAPQFSDFEPSNGQRLDPGTSVRLAVTALDPDQGDRVEWVTFFVEGRQVGVDLKAPFEWNWTPPSVGTYRFSVEALDNRGARARSAVVVFSVTEETPCDPEPPQVVINEINFQPLPAVYDGDWIELANPSSEPIDVGGWVLKDAVALNAFVFPEGWMLPADGYVVVVEDSLRFALVHAGKGPIAGKLGFTLDNYSEHLELLSRSGCLVDSLTYRSLPPWPQSPAGRGRTLALKSPDLDNTQVDSWASSAEQGGTPGWLNFEIPPVPIEQVDLSDELPTEFALDQNYPNPFNPATTIAFELPNPARVRLTVYSMLGMRVAELVNDDFRAGRHEVRFDASRLASGTYVYVFEGGGLRLAKMMVLLK